MPLRHDDELPPLTPAQQAEAIRIAARLQAEHEATSSSEAFRQAAEEAGIERRFLDEAVRHVGRKAEPTLGMSRTLVATLLLATLNGLVLAHQPAESVGVVLADWHIALLVVIPFLASSWVGRERRVRWTMPMAVVAVWLALALPDAAYHLLLEGRTLRWLPALVVIVGGLQFVAALIGAFAHWHRPARHPRLSHLG